ncbi:Trihelix transcription factor ASIL2 [Senna tora]|uniref:Trihelix transcription factor ASIL2 n=1 Tax=Senna tora TaxID=362788 RepID=A0A834WJ90_9FABA|nr:Trihelix transcription factor ASIL2 [Senna tora]
MASFAVGLTILSDLQNHSIARNRHFIPNFKHSQPHPPLPFFQSCAATSPLPPLMDSLTGAPPPAAASAPSRTSSSPFPGREDCWSEDATYTLIDAWGERHLELNRGNLRQKHWQEVADAVNAHHGHVKKARRTDVQCKNRIDTLKKKYKIEKNKVIESEGDYTSPWPFFARLDPLIGDSFPLKRISPPADTDRRSTPPAKSPAWVTSHVPVGPRSGTQKRPAAPSPAPANIDDSYFRRNFSAFAAAAAAAAEAEDAESDDSDASRSSSASGGRRRGRGREKKRENDRDWEFGYRELAQAIERFGEIYERVEAAKQRQMVELEKQRMQFAKDLEYQRMQLFMETQVQLQKIKRVKRSSRAVGFTITTNILEYIPSPTKKRVISITKLLLGCIVISCALVDHQSVALRDTCGTLRRVLDVPFSVFLIASGDTDDGESYGEEYIDFSFGHEGIYDI